VPSGRPAKVSAFGSGMWVKSTPDASVVLLPSALVRSVQCQNIVQPALEPNLANTARRVYSRGLTGVSIWNSDEPMNGAALGNSWPSRQGKEQR
jgi:hypothetical protein